MHKMEKTLRENIRAGRGQGHGAGYQPWLQIARRKMPSNSNINLRNLPQLGRHGHFLSRNEVNIGIWLLWLGADDLREQFPLWPFEHPHPLYGHPAMTEHRLPWSRGTLTIARELGIDHGWCMGKSIPYVATTDFLLTVFMDGTPRVVAVAAKPAAIVEGHIKATQRVKERLALELAYARELGIPWHLLSDECIPLPLRENLELNLTAAVLPETLACPARIEDYCGGLADDLRAGTPLGESRERANQRQQLNEIDGRALFNHGLWTRRLPVDLRLPLAMSQPATLTDFSWAETAATTLLHGGHHG
jgi:hypothetical protein